MAEIIDIGLSQFHGSDEEFELLIALSDGKEIGHLVKLDAVRRIAEEFADYAPVPAALSAIPQPVAVPEPYGYVVELRVHHKDMGRTNTIDRSRVQPRLKVAEACAEHWGRIYSAGRGWHSVIVPLYTTPPSSLREEKERLTTCGVADPSSRDCPNMKEVGGGMDGERYRCAVCGKGYFLDYEEMK